MKTILAIRIWNYLKGYVIIKVEGINLERFINLAITNNIIFWDIERVNYTTLKGKVGLKGYKHLRSIRKRINCRVSILERKGCPFLLHRIFKRKALVAGGISAILIMYFLTSFVWVVEVQGNERMPSERIIRELESFGLKPGAFKPYIDTREVETKLLIEMDQLVWVGINILGTRAVVDIVERTEPPPLIDKNAPCNIVAKKDGIINDIYVYQGQAAVKVSDTVKVGQLLISGIVEQPGKPTRVVHAMGRVEARTWYQLTEEQQLRLVKRERTGRMERGVFLRVGERTLSLNRKACEFENFDTETETSRLIEWRNITLPVELVIEKYYEVIVEEEILPVEVAVERAVEKTAQRLTGMLPREVEISDRKAKYIETETDTIRVDVIFETLEDIGLEEKIDINYRED
ncbi:MAG: sporulation protein YqfD [Clostridia bacterium]|nr:sporulation protein YqfD [Clostridiales bacterium]